MADPKVDILIKARDEASKQLEGIRGKIDSMSKGMAIAGGVMVGAGIAITAALGGAMKAAAEEEAGIVRLSTAMKNVGISYDEVRGSLEKWIDTQQQKTAIADSEQRDALASLIRMTGDLTKAQDMLTLGMDIAVGTGRDLASANTLLMYAMGGNWGQLEQYIPAIKAAATEEEKWRLLRELFAGQAEAYGKTMDAQMKLLQHNLSDIKESIGALVMEAVTPLIEKVQSVVVTLKAWIDLNPEMMRVITLTAGATGIGALVIGFGLLATVMVVKVIPATIAMITTVWHLVTALLAAIIATGPWGWAAAVVALGTIIASSVIIHGKMTASIKEVTDANEKAGKGLDDVKEKQKEYNKELDSAIGKEKSLAAAMGFRVSLLQTLGKALITAGYQVSVSPTGQIITAPITPAPLPVTPEGYYIGPYGEVLPIPEMQFGGIVPGPIGKPRLIMAHGGEAVGRQGDITIPIYLDGELIAEKVIRRVGDEASLQGVT